MKKFLYRGSMTTENIDKKDYVFVNGKEYNLPEANPRVLQMERQGRLTAVVAGTKVDEKIKKGTK